jgi:hypothetical protein
MMISQSHDTRLEVRSLKGLKIYSKESTNQLEKHNITPTILMVFTSPQANALTAL